MLEAEKKVLLDIAAEHDGLLTVDSVLNAAKDEESPLHKHFEWDDTEAANEYRRWQARALIAKCKITVESKPDTLIRAFVSLPSDRASGGGYRVTVDALKTPDQKAEILADMRARVSYWIAQGEAMDIPVRRALVRLNTALHQQSGGASESKERPGLAR